LAEYFESRRFLPSPISRREEKHLGGTGIMKTRPEKRQKNRSILFRGRKYGRQERET